MSGDGRHLYPVRVYYEDTDAGGVVYHARYLGMAERARTEALRTLGVPHAEMVATFQRMFVVRRVELDYLHPARLDDELTIATEPVIVGGASVTLRQSFFRAGDGRSIAVAEVQLVCTAPGGERPERIPPRWRQALQAMHRARRVAEGTVLNEE